MFFILPVAVDYQARRYPMVTFTLIGVNTVFYLLTWLLLLGSDLGERSLMMNLGLVPAEKVWWTWITSMFVHAGFFHFIGNMVYLFLFGACVEDLVGRVRFSIFYLAGGLIANLSQVVLSTEADALIPIVGASGAISTCIGAFLILLPGTKINFRYFLWVFIRFFQGDFWLSAQIVITAWFVLDFLSLVAELGAPQGGGGVAFGAHVGGTAAGALAMWAMHGKGIPDRGERPSRSSARPVRSARDRPGLGATGDVYLQFDGKEVGPYAPPKVRAMAGLGSFPRSARYRTDGMSEWRPLSDL